MVYFENRRVADPVLRDFLRTCIEYENTHERFKTFLNLNGIHVSEGRIIKFRESKKDYLRELQFESSDTLIMYLRFML